MSCSYACGRPRDWYVGHNYCINFTDFVVTGKSTAARCALSLCGQQHVSHIMKTDSTSNTICNERMVHSTLPFILDDPKTPDSIGELLITVYDGASSGNLRRGFRKPRSIPLLCCNFSTSSIQRYIIIMALQSCNLMHLCDLLL